MEKYSNEANANQRRSAGYLPTIWTPEFIHSFTAPYSHDLYGTRLEELKQCTKKLLAATKDPRQLLKLVDSTRRLGLAYHFEKEIKESLLLLCHFVPIDLYDTALHFRLLREHGFPVTSEVFDKFRRRYGRFIGKLKEDVGGLLSLYEASYLGMDGEDVLEEAKSFSARHLKNLLKAGKLESNMAEQIQQSLEVPLRYRMPRTEARSFIEIYRRDNTKNLVLLDLAQLDYNLMQSVYLDEINELSSWWWGLNFKEKMPFARDRFLECYFWAMGSVPEPQFREGRRNLTKFACITTALDDVYDVYGSLEELEKFTDAIDRWDLEAVEGLPEYMKTIYAAIYDSVNETVNDALRDLGMNILPYIKEQWVSYCRAMLVEAGWIYKGYMPNFDEYLQNAWVSIGIAAGLTYAIFGVGDESIVQSLLDCIDNWSSSELYYWPCLIIRLYDDLTTSTVEIERGESANSIQCYMVQEGVTEEEAREFIKGLITDAWKKLNKLIAQSSLPNPAVNAAISMTRCVHRMYQYGDWFGIQSKANKDCVVSYLLSPIPMEPNGHAVM